MTKEQFEEAQIICKELKTIKDESEWLNSKIDDLDVYESGHYRFVPVDFRDTLIITFRDYYIKKINSLEQRFEQL